ncbi:uncharacterized protein LOC127852487 [Dreissena polymorpha]|uniref:uncharacterized protein LOC127852487 n=1 Tax=Dreissena polymorpha TaxID=45954 RepID=UPI0022654EE3|nr:uncharacterized protein LOC127852487 [Dreissena polymorpha]
MGIRTPEIERFSNILEACLGEEAEPVVMMVFRAPTLWLTVSGASSLLSASDQISSSRTAKLNPIFARYKFYKEIQGGDSIDAFITRLRLTARDCNFRDTDDMIRDRIVFGTNSSKIREKLINIGAELTLDKAIQIAQSLEYSQKQLRTMTEQDVHRIHTMLSGSAVQPQRQQLQSDRRSESNTARVKTREHSKQSCDFCGRKHPKTAKCPAKGV